MVPVSTFALFRLVRQRIATSSSEREAKALAYILLEEELGIKAIDIYTDKVKHLSEEEEQCLETSLQRLEAGEPIQYILGHAPFLHRSFIVSPAVLIPRPETEELALWVIEEQQTFQGRLIDAGTGSGCLAISLSLALPKAQVEAWDISQEALNLAQQNAQHFKASVTFYRKNILEQTGTLKATDIIVSNPPYVCLSEAQEMATRVLDYEPHLALFVPDEDALKFYSSLANLGANIVYCEINEHFPTETQAIFAHQGYETLVRHDMFGKPRMLKAWHKT